MQIKFNIQIMGDSSEFQQIVQGGIGPVCSFACSALVGLGKFIPSPGGSSASSCLGFWKSASSRGLTVASEEANSAYECVMRAINC